MTTGIRLVPVDLIDPHPHNPRRDLGDLTELAASIKAHGVRQNLLLVPSRDRYLTAEEEERHGLGTPGMMTRAYTAVIGHRRLTACTRCREGLADWLHAVGMATAADPRTHHPTLDDDLTPDTPPIDEGDPAMKLSAKLPKRNGLDESDLPGDLLDSPTTTRVLIVEVACGKTETTFDEYGDPYTVPTAQVLSAEYVTDAHEQMNARMIARRAFDRRRGADTLPGVDSIAREFRDNIASTLTRGSSMTISAGGKSATIHGEAIDPDTGEVLAGEDER